MSFITKLGKHAGRAATGTTKWVVENPKTAALTAAAPIVAVTAVPMVLGTVGFGAGGVTAGSLAASIHMVIGNVVTPGLFSFLQSAGAGGAALPIVKGVVGGTMALASTAFVATKVKGKDAGNAGKKNSSDLGPKSKL